jgi:hypothetical protein
MSGEIDEGVVDGRKAAGRRLKGGREKSSRQKIEGWINQLVVSSHRVGE